MFNLHDNFLNYSDFIKINKILTGQLNGVNFPWYISTIDVDNNFNHNNKYNLHFVHLFYSENNGVASNWFNLLEPLIEKINPQKILSIKANCSIATEKNLEWNFHVDRTNCKTAIYYINTNDGYTIFENGQTINCVENRFIIFDSNIKHAGASCTDQKTKILINFNYL